MSDDATLVPTRATEKKNSAKKAAKSSAPAHENHTSYGQPHGVTATAPHSEADLLAEKAALVLQSLVLSVLYDDADRPRGAANQRLDDADHLLGRLLTPEGHEWVPGDPETGDIKGHLERISHALEEGLEELQCGVPGLGTYDYAVVSAHAWYAFDFADRLLIAYSNLPASLDDLRAMTTQAGAYAGIKRHRDPPQPPIRRVEALSPGQYKTVLERVAGRVSTLHNVILLAQRHDDDWSASIALDAAEALAEMIGAMADDAIGGEIAGGAEGWFYGPDFRNASKGAEQ